MISVCIFKNSTNFEIFGHYFLDENLDYYFKILFYLLFQHLILFLDKMKLLCELFFY